MIEDLQRCFKAILFDLDGVLIDSMPHHVAAWQRIFAELGIEVPSEILRRSEGEKAKITIRRLAKQHGLDLTETQLDDLINRKRAIYRRSAPKGMRQVAYTLLQTCRTAGLKVAIVTGSVRSNLEWTLSSDELQLFDLVISSEQYQSGKPHPEPYLKAANILGIDPLHCLVIENAPLGIQSAKAAGMTCVAITTTLPPEVLKEADFILTDLDDLLNRKIDFSTVKPGDSQCRT
ncbi:MAG: HAD family phosphatase [bacterium]|nr:HAD family phosphatase [bacterium]